jgi:hypothetical protein
MNPDAVRAVQLVFHPDPGGGPSKRGSRGLGFGLWLEPVPKPAVVKQLRVEYFEIFINFSHFFSKTPLQILFAVIC